ncbi:MAG: hypothetical protein ABI970_11230 [Chloroflexota bacterium]
MKSSLLDRLPMIPRLMTIPRKIECLQPDYLGWQLLEEDDNTQEILICKPCSAVWLYTRSKHLLSLCAEAALGWKHNSAVSIHNMTEWSTDNHEVLISGAKK